MSSPQLKPLILLCDGTWCGRETSTETNIYELAKIIGIDFKTRADNEKDDIHFISQSNPAMKGKKGRYIHGVGLGSTFLDYVFNGITAQDIAEQCIGAYRYIVDNYVGGEYEIWMFGLSRGAYTIRCVAGMINNCGIVKRDNLSEIEIDLLCREVYRIYRSEYKIDEPGSAQSKAFRKGVSWPQIGDDDDDEASVVSTTNNSANEQKGTRAPIRFMGLFDTVGSLGMPSFTGGVGLEWPGFYDQNVSSVVEHVYQATSLHDRMYVFEPCLAGRDSTKKKWGRREKWNIHQKWFPGTHYDLGRQRFKFFRDGVGVSLAESLLAKIGLVSKVIEPNHVLADLVLKWMLESIKKHDANSLVIESFDKKAIVDGILSNGRKIGDGDVYNHIVEYAPLGKLGLEVWKNLPGVGSHVNAIYELLFALRDRHIPEDDADVYDYKTPDPEISGRMSIQELAGIPNTTGIKVEDEKKRYPSRTYDTWDLKRRLRL
ncbi:hypothetical protein BGZ57DRAFT_919765 [Hyaloscypha finlandica]|nr:hypothetical protein BGZ57DRAFT_919765 [Hyaloscypha finlandica]